jgi:hypothetical protein
VVVVGVVEIQQGTDMPNKTAETQWII